MKSRGVYETPGGTILMAAHEQLEELTLDRETMETKKKLGSQFAQVVYEGKWYTPLREGFRTENLHVIRHLMQFVYLCYKLIHHLPVLVSASF